ncbi:hypothetical protein HDV57DRAFT_505317 [Trichoderma longibrachiatum]|uniref:Ankyrin repeat protein n=1 Tax=Trichoderma longibrachiatum ATCC 18648 TaxID=983965 RepID=A0A2T4BTJ9_TRILO|nr:hypothetical protein M440DRAFT_1405066 [Trichoderma longibrachiatum ATCC 18648]
MAANVPGIIWSALRALNLNEVVRDSPTRRDSSASSDSPYEPSLVDIALVKAMLIRAKQLPPDLVDAVLDMAEYWAHSTTRLDERIGILGGNEERENRFLLRSYPLGLVDAGVRQNANDQPYTTTLPTPRPLGKALDASFFAKSAKYPVPRLAHPARKVVFRIRSQDQGYVSNPEDAKEPYSKSWTWFDVGLERFDADGATDGSVPSVNSLRPVQPPIRQTSTDPVGYNYTHQLLHSPEWEIQRNQTALKKWQDHTITWSYLDDIDPESEAGKALEEQGRGRATGNGKFVRELQVGDVITVWGKARFPGWCNRVESVQIDVYWAV